MKRREILLVDVGNTCVKFAASRGRRIRPVAGWPTHRLGVLPSHVLLDSGPDRYAGAAFACVVPGRTAALRRILRRVVDGPVYEINCALPMGIRIRYPRPGQIGADRLANAAGVVDRYRCPAVVVDFGTALTFDVVSGRAEYLGGVIAPGLDALTFLLHRRTALLPEIRLAEPKRFVGKSTVEAMRIGAVHGYRGMVRSLLRGILAELGEPDAFVCATGGHARLVCRRMSEVHVIDPSVTMRGLAAIYRFQEDQAR